MCIIARRCTRVRPRTSIIQRPFPPPQSLRRQTSQNHGGWGWARVWIAAPRVTYVVPILLHYERVRSRTSFHSCVSEGGGLYVRPEELHREFPFPFYLQPTSLSPLPTTLAAVEFSFHVLPTIQFIRGIIPGTRGGFEAPRPNVVDVLAPIIPARASPFHPRSLNRDARIDESPTFPRSCSLRPNMADSSFHFGLQLRPGFARPLVSSCLLSAKKEIQWHRFFFVRKMSIFHSYIGNRGEVMFLFPSKFLAARWRKVSPDTKVDNIFAKVTVV